jgi:ferritin-like metal-binding protein YciE
METTCKKSQFYTLFLSELKEMLWVEQKIWGMLRLIQGVAQSPDFSRILGQSRVHASSHIDRVRHVFALLEETAESIESDAMAKMIQSIERAVAKSQQNAAMGDMALIIAAQKAGQYKIACYENLITLSQILGDQQINDLLESNVIDDAGTDLLLRELSERYIFKEASSRKLVGQHAF